MDLRINPKKIRTIFPQEERIILPRPYLLEPPTAKEFLKGLFGRGYRKYFADVSITASSVTIGTKANIVGRLIIGETLTAGNVVYLKSADGKFYKAYNTGTAEQYTVAGIALNGGSAGQSLQIQSAGQIFIGATLTLVQEYFLSSNAGRICPAVDVVTGREMVRIGYADTVNTLTFDIRDLGIAP